MKVQNIGIKITFENRANFFLLFQLKLREICMNAAPALKNAGAAFFKSFNCSTKSIKNALKMLVQHFLMQLIAAQKSI